MNEVRKWLRSLSAKNKKTAMKIKIQELLEVENFPELYQYLTDFHFIKAKIEAAQTLELIADYDLALNSPQSSNLTTEQTKNLRLIQAVIRLSEHILKKDKKQLVEQLWSRLVDIENPDIQNLLAQAKKSRRNPWLRSLISSLPPPDSELIRTINAHEGAVIALTLTPDEKQIISGATDGTIKVWNLTTAAEILTFTGHTKTINSLAVTSDQKLLVSASEDTTIKIWDLVTKTEKITLNNLHSEPVTSVVITPDDKELISSSNNGSINIYDLEKNQDVFTIKAHKAEVTSVTLTPNGEEIVSTSNDKTIKVWNRKKRKLITTIHGHNAEILGAIVTPDGKQVIAHDVDGVWDVFYGEIFVWDWKTGERIFVLSGHDDAVDSLAVTPDNKYLLSGDSQGIIKVWNLETGKEIYTFRDHNICVNKIIITTDAKQAISCSTDGTIKVWDLTNILEQENFNYSQISHCNEIHTIAITPNSRWAISGGCDMIVKVWDLTNFREVFDLETGNGEPIHSLAVTPDGKEVLVGCGGSLPSGKKRTIKFFNRKTREQILEFLAPGNLGKFITIAPDGKTFISGYWRDFGTTVWDLELKEKIGYLGKHEEEVLCLAITPDGRKVISGSYDRTVIVWDFQTKERILTLNAGFGPVYSVAVTPDNKYIISGYYHGEIIIWDLTTGDQVAMLKGHQKYVLEIIPLPNNRIISASLDGTLKLWNLNSQKAIATFYGNSGFLCCAATANGEMIIAGDNFGKLHFLTLEN